MKNADERAELYVDIRASISDKLNGRVAAAICRYTGESRHALKTAAGLRMMFAASMLAHELARQ